MGRATRAAYLSDRTAVSRTTAPSSATVGGRRPGAPSTSASASDFGGLSREPHYVAAQAGAMRELQGRVARIAAGSEERLEFFEMDALYNAQLQRVQGQLRATAELNAPPERRPEVEMDEGAWKAELLQTPLRQTMAAPELSPISPGARRMYIASTRSPAVSGVASPGSRRSTPGSLRQQRKRRPETAEAALTQQQQRQQRQQTPATPLLTTFSDAQIDEIRRDLCVAASARLPRGRRSPTRLPKRDAAADVADRWGLSADRAGPTNEFWERSERKVEKPPPGKHDGRYQVEIVESPLGFKAKAVPTRQRVHFDEDVVKAAEPARRLKLSQRLRTRNEFCQRGLRTKSEEQDRHGQHTGSSRASIPARRKPAAAGPRLVDHVASGTRFSAAELPAAAQLRDDRLTGSWQHPESAFVPEGQLAPCLPRGATVGLPGLKDASRRADAIRLERLERHQKSGEQSLRHQIQDVRAYSPQHPFHATVSEADLHQIGKVRAGSPTKQDSGRGRLFEQ